MAITVMRASMMNMRTLVQDNRIPGNFILQNGGFGSAHWVTKLIFRSYRSRKKSYPAFRERRSLLPWHFSVVRGTQVADALPQGRNQTRPSDGWSQPSSASTSRWRWLTRSSWRGRTSPWSRCQRSTWPGSSCRQTAGARTHRTHHRWGTLSRWTWGLHNNVRMMENKKTRSRLPLQISFVGMSDE